MVPQVLKAERVEPFADGNSIAYSNPEGSIGPPLGRPTMVILPAPNFQYDLHLHSLRKGHGSITCPCADSSNVFVEPVTSPRCDPR
jgi:hypothetical protein